MNGKILEVRNISKKFPAGDKGKFYYAVNNVSFSMKKGEFLGLVGESGCGKSTLSRMLMGLLPADSGEIFFQDKTLRYPYNRITYQNIQTVFQMPKDSFDPRRTIDTVLMEMMKNFGFRKSDARERISYLLKKVGLSDEYLKKRPSEMSGGECQRVAIARALTVSPKLVICDECTSALDVSVQAQVVELLCRLKKEMDLSILFISHDLSLVSGICDNIMVMNHGEIVECGMAKTVLENPQNQYTKRLLESVLKV